MARRDGRCRCWLWGGAGRLEAGSWWKASAGSPPRWLAKMGWRSRSTPEECTQTTFLIPCLIYRKPSTCTPRLFNLRLVSDQYPVSADTHSQGMEKERIPNYDGSRLTRSCLSVMLIFSTMDQNQRLNWRSLSAFSPVEWRSLESVYDSQMYNSKSFTD